MPQATYEGRVEALPIEVDVSPMYARKDLLDKVGMGIPKTFEELRAASQAILKADPTIQAFGLPVSSANDAEGQIRQIIWSFGGAMFAKDGKTVTFNSPETQAAYQFIADMVAEGTIPRSAVTWDDAGNNNAYQTGRAAFVVNPPSIYAWMQANDKELLANTALINIPKGPGAKGKAASAIGSWLWLVPKSSKQIDAAKGWLRYFYEPTRYQKIIETVGGRWLPIYPEMMSMPLFKDNPDYANFGAMAESGIIDGYEGPPTALASRVNNAKIVTQVDPEDPRRRHVHCGCRRLGSGGDRETRHVTSSAGREAATGRGGPRAARVRRRRPTHAIGTSAGVSAVPSQVSHRRVSAGSLPYPYRLAPQIVGNEQRKPTQHATRRAADPLRTEVAGQAGRHLCPEVDKVLDRLSDGHPSVPTTAAGYSRR